MRRRLTAPSACLQLPCPRRLWCFPARAGGNSIRTTASGTIRRPRPRPRRAFCDVRRNPPRAGNGYGNTSALRSRSGALNSPPWSPRIRRCRAPRPASSSAATTGGVAGPGFTCPVRRPLRCLPLLATGGLTITRGCADLAEPHPATSTTTGQGRHVSGPERGAGAPVAI